MDKTQAKLLALSLLAPFQIAFQNNKKIGFIFGVVSELVLTKWDEAWDTYIKKNGMQGVDALAPDDVEKIVATLTQAFGAAVAQPKPGAKKP